MLKIYKIILIMALIMSIFALIGTVSAADFNNTSNINDIQNFFK